MDTSDFEQQRTHFIDKHKCTWRNMARVLKVSEDALERVRDAILDGRLSGDLQPNAYRCNDEHSSERAKV